MEPKTKAYNLDPSSYTFANCMLWGLARAHFNKISAAWEAKAYGAALKHLVLGILEGIPVLGQFFSLTEKRWTRIPSKINTNQSLNYDRLKSLRIKYNGNLKTLFNYVSTKSSSGSEILVSSKDKHHIFTIQNTDHDWVLYFYSEDDAPLSEEDLSEMMPKVFSSLHENNIQIDRMIEIASNDQETTQNWRTWITKQNMNNKAERICGQATTLQTSQLSAPRLLVPPTVSTEPKTVISSPPVQPVSSPKPVTTNEAWEKIQFFKKQLTILYNTREEGWVMVPPKNMLQVGNSLVIGSGSAGFPGNGNWKIHISIHPEDMTKALPILLDTLWGDGMPVCGFKVQTIKNLETTHQIGKEVALLFGKTAETTDIIKKTLNLLAKNLHTAGVRTEPGCVLTVDTMEQVTQSSQEKEKQNLECGKFDKAIPSSSYPTYFHYRDDNTVPMLDSGMESAGLTEDDGVTPVSKILVLAKSTDAEKRALAHNPSGKPDPIATIVLD